MKFYFAVKVKCNDINLSRNQTILIFNKQRSNNLQKLKENPLNTES
ncbi:MAG: hypothetical protein AVDCRST_MAG96-865 [uncultured Segetibacter sp.]|uniref:Uncharacterized protein n=1 Tax=uncultured Segetibacter sp. TaxID=481133 RepID=A0A6J4RVH5_9BACT|nr:MAG: hypothetical protein AVDCRST_MAG96-865 [uncultured Segetibacter sp.]